MSEDKNEDGEKRERERWEEYKMQKKNAYKSKRIYVHTKWRVKNKDRKALEGWKCPIVRQSA